MENNDSHFIAHPLASECLDISEGVKLDGVDPNKILFVQSLVDCHRFCRAQQFDKCSTYVYNMHNGLCELFSKADTEWSQRIEDSESFTTISLLPGCFDENLRGIARNF